MAETTPATRHAESSEPPSKETIEAEVARLDRIQPWVHDIDLPHEVRTCPDIPTRASRNRTKWPRLEPLYQELELAGKRVLDVGCNEGFYAIKAAEHGAHVVGLDIDERRIKKAEYARDVLGLANLEYTTQDIYSDAFDELGRFDVCLALGFIHRLPDPYRAIERLAGATDTILFEWAIQRGPGWEIPVAHYIPGVNDPDNVYTPKYWRPTPACLESILRDQGFTRFRLIDDRETPRVILLAGRKDHPGLTPRRGDIRRGPTRRTPGRVLKRTMNYVSGLLTDLGLR